MAAIAAYVERNFDQGRRSRRTKPRIYSSQGLQVGHERRVTIGMWNNNGTGDLRRSLNLACESNVLAKIGLEARFVSET